MYPNFLSPPIQLSLVQQIHFFPSYIPHMLANFFKCVARFNHGHCPPFDVNRGGITLHFTNSITCSFPSVEQPFSLLVPRRLLLRGFIIKRNIIRGYILRNLHCFSPHPIKKFRITLIITEFRLIITEFNVVRVTVTLTDTASIV